MTKNIKDLLSECECSDYDLCLKYLQKCCPELDIDCIYSDDCYLTSKEDLVRMAKECLKEKLKNGKL